MRGPETARLKPRSVVDMQQIFRALFSIITLLALGQAAAAQEAPAAAVGYTPALEHAITQNVQLPGYVESPRVSRIASEVPGLVAEFSAREGDRVTRGQPLLRLNSAPLELELRAARAELSEAEARRGMAERNLVRARDLFSKKTIAQQQLDESESDSHAWEGRVRSLQAEIARIELDVARSTVRAPFAGIVTRRMTEIGQWADAGTELLELVSLEVLEVHVDVPEQYFAALQPQSAAGVSFDSIPGHAFAARVRAVIPKADAAARTFPVKLVLDAADPRIGIGMLARVELDIGGAATAVLVPKDALVRQGPGQVLYLINGDNTIAPVAVRPGAALGAWVAVEGEVRAGQKVVTRGNERLQPGQAVAGKPVDYALP